MNRHLAVPGVLAALALVLALGAHAPSTFAQTPVECDQDYTVVAGDWLATIASKFYGDGRAYIAIVIATNQKAETDPSYTPIADPNAIEVGARLCIPTVEDASALMAQAAEPAPLLTPGTLAPPQTLPAALPSTVTLTARRLSPDDIDFDPQFLAKEIKGIVVPATPYDNRQPPGAVGAPAHIAFEFDGTQRLWVIPAQAYQTLGSNAGNPIIRDALAQLRTLLADQPQAPEPPLPFVPPPAGTNDLAARVQYITFDGGSGIAYLGRWAQDPSPVLASQVYFNFVGLTNDGSYVVAFQYPVHTSSLPDTTDELTPEHLSDIERDPRTYFRETTDILNQLRPSAFGPDLRRLETLVSSLKIPSSGPAPVAPALPTLTLFARTPTRAAGLSGTATPPTTAARSTDPQKLLGVEWKWVETTGSGAATVVTEPGTYSIRFNNQGGFGIRAACNIGAGNYRVSGDALEFTGVMSTLGDCGEGALDKQFTAQLQDAASFYLEGTNLYIVLKNGATMKFAP